MTAIEIILLIVGMLFILGSFWATEKLSTDELEHISELSKEEMSVMLEHELESSRQKVSEMVEDTIDASKERTERSLEQQTNEKIMAINEYSDTVIEKMNKTHNEIMFLYSMLNDKHTELTNFSSGLTQQLQDLKEQEEEMTNYYLEQLKQQKPQYTPVPPEPAQIPSKPPKPQEAEQAEPETEDAADADTVVAANAEPDADPVSEADSEEEINIREKILQLYEEGKDSVAIARKLGMGVGEVRLILGLYKGEHSGEV